MARTSESSPVFTCAWPVTSSPFTRRRMVPSMPAIGIEAMNSGITGLIQAACSRAPRLPALMRSMRESPEPFSITSSGAAMFFAAIQARTAATDFCVLADEPRPAVPSVRNKCRAMMLLENLLVSRTISASAGVHGHERVSRRRAIARASVRVPPLSIQSGGYARHGR